MTDILLRNIKDVYRKIAHAAMRVGREPVDVNLVAVTKNHGPEMLQNAVDRGLRVFGENRVQEARSKILDFKAHNSLPLEVGGYSGVRWHLLGNLQKNKVKTAVELFDVIQSVDSIELAEEINKQAEKAGKQLDVLVQIKLSDEESKHGVSRENYTKLLEEIKHMGNLNLIGLMTIPPYFYDAEKSRPYFRELRNIKERLEENGFQLPELSIGMSNDFEIAIEEGATMVRIGTAIFGERIQE